MDNLSSTAKGDSLEDKVYALISRLVENGDFLVNGKTSTVFKKKRYYSKDRGSDLILDVTIETTFPGANTYSLLTIIECKNTGRKVSVDDIEEFASKIRGIGDHNTKGIMISTKGFQDGTLRYANINKIGLIRLDGDGSLEHLVYRVSNILPSEPVFLAEQFPKQAYDSAFIGLYDDRFYKHFPDLFLKLGVIDTFYYNINSIKLPYISEEQIEQLITQLSLDKVVIDEKVDTMLLCERVSQLYDADFYFGPHQDTNDRNMKILGKVSFDPLLVSVFNMSDVDVRSRFTLAHEIGHVVLHSTILQKLADPKLEIKSFDNDIPSINNIEIQANKFAATLLLPDELVRYHANLYFQKERIHKGYLYMDSQPCNKQLVHTLLDHLKLKFGVSKEVIKIKMKKMGLLKEVRDNRFIGDHFGGGTKRY